MTARWLIRSASRYLTVEGPPRLDGWWPILSTQIPGTYGDVVGGDSGAATLTLTDSVSPADARRIINASLHVEQLDARTLSVHGVAVAKQGRTVLLIGDYGAGKSLTGLAMIMSMGWSPVAGDTCLVRVGETGIADVVGGTRAFVVRRNTTERWFPAIPLSGRPGERVDLAESLPGNNMGEVHRLVSIVMVAVDGDGVAPELVRCGEQLAANALYRASGHLLMKVLDDAAADPLSLLEDPARARRRLLLVRRLASSIRCWWVRGTPSDVAVAIDALTRKGISGD